jgi:replicative DNA helicase
MTMGLQPGHLWVIAARPSIGKTTLAMNIATNAARLAQKRSAVFSLEMGREELEDRMLSSLSDVDHQRIMSGFLGELDHRKIGVAMSAMHDLPVHIDDTSGRGAPSIRRICRRMKGDTGLDLVVVDYLQLMPGTLDRRTTRDEQLDDICLKLKSMAKELRVPVILLSQLNRDSEKRNDPRPQLSDLRGSGAIEQHADGVFFLHRKNYREGGATEGIIAKQRNGPTGTIGLHLQRETLLFTERELVADLPEPEKPKGKPKGKGKAAQGELVPAPSHNPED